MRPRVGDPVAISVGNERIRRHPVRHDANASTRPRQTSPSGVDLPERLRHADAGLDRPAFTRGAQNRDPNGAATAGALTKPNSRLLIRNVI